MSEYIQRRRERVDEAMRRILDNLDELHPGQGATVQALTCAIDDLIDAKISLQDALDMRAAK